MPRTPISTFPRITDGLPLKFRERDHRVNVVGYGPLTSAATASRHASSFQSLLFTRPEGICITRQNGGIGGPSRTRTDDLPLAGRMLSQLSYRPMDQELRNRTSGELMGTPNRSVIDSSRPLSGLLLVRHSRSESGLFGKIPPDRIVQKQPNWAALLYSITRIRQRLPAETQSNKL